MDHQYERGIGLRAGAHFAGANLAGAEMRVRSGYRDPYQDCVQSVNRVQRAREHDGYAEPRYEVEEMLRNAVCITGCEVHPDQFSTERRALHALGLNILNEMDTRRSTFYRMRERIAELDFQRNEENERYGKMVASANKDREYYRSQYSTEQRVTSYLKSVLSDLQDILLPEGSDRLDSDMFADAVARSIILLSEPATTSDGEDTRKALIERAGVYLAKKEAEQASDMPEPGVPHDVEAPVAEGINRVGA